MSRSSTSWGDMGSFDKPSHKCVSRVGGHVFLADWNKPVIEKEIKKKRWRSRKCHIHTQEFLCFVFFSLQSLRLVLCSSKMPLKAVKMWIFLTLPTVCMLSVIFMSLIFCSHHLPAHIQWNFYISPFQMPSSLEGKLVKFTIIIIIACFYSMGPFTQDMSLWENDKPLNKVWAHQYAADELWNSDLWLNKPPSVLYKINSGVCESSEGQNAN